MWTFERAKKVTQGETNFLGTEIAENAVRDSVDVSLGGTPGGTTQDTGIERRIKMVRFCELPVQVVPNIQTFLKVTITIVKVLFLVGWAG